MAITSTQGAAIPNMGAMNANQRKDAGLAITQVQLADCWRTKAGGGGRTISNTPHIRVDMQGLDGNGQANLQAQINGINGNSTVAHVLLLIRPVSQVSQVSVVDLRQPPDLA